MNHFKIGSRLSSLLDATLYERERGAALIWELFFPCLRLVGRNRKKLQRVDSWQFPIFYLLSKDTHFWSIRKSYIVGPECLLWIMLFLNQALREFISKGNAEQPLPSLANIVHSCICFLLFHAPPGAAVSFHSQVVIRARPHIRGFHLTVLVSLFGDTPTMISIPV